MKKYFFSLLFLLVSVIPSFSQGIRVQAPQGGAAVALGHHLTGDCRLFNHSSLTLENKNYPILGMWSPSDHNGHIMCVYAKKDWDTYYFLMICNGSQAKTWISSLNDMKELFLKNNQIAKDNGVSSDITKDVSDKFSFDGLYGNGIGRYDEWGPIVQKYSGQGGYEYTIRVIYKYKSGQSTMELHVMDYGKRSNLIWVFKSREDFDTIINALNWDDFMAAYYHQLQEYQNQQNAAKTAQERQKNESALFD